jgi:hypothetical protein
VRIYDLREDSLMETALLIYELGFYKLGYDHSHFDVVKGNLKIVKFHKNFGATEIEQDDENLYLTLTRQQYELMREKYQRFLLK